MSNPTPPGSESGADRPQGERATDARLQDLHGLQPEITRQMLELRRFQETLAADMRMEIQRMQADLAASQRKEEQVIDELHTTQGFRERVRQDVSAAAEANQRIVELEARYDEVQRMIVLARTEVQQMQHVTTELRQAEEKLRQAEEAREIQIREMQQLDQNLQDARAEHAKESEKLHGVRRQNEAVIELLQGELASEQKQRAAAEQGLQSLTAERDEALRSVQQWEKRYAAAEAEFAKIRSQLKDESEQLGDQIAELSGEIERLRGEVGVRDALEEKLEIVVDQRDRLGNELKSMQETFERTVEDYSAVQRQLSDENHSLQTVVDDLRTQNDALLSDMERIEQALSQQKNQWGKAQARCEELEGVATELRQQQAAAEQAYAERDERMREQAQTAYEEVKQKHDVLETTVEDLRSQNQSLLSDIDRMEKGLAQQLIDLEKTQAERDEFERETVELREQVTASRTDFAAREKELQEENARVHQIVTELLATVDEHDLERSQWQDERREHAAMVAQRDQLAETVNQLQERIVGLEQDAQTNEEAFWRQREEMQADADSLRNEVQQMIRRQSAAEEELLLAQQRREEFQIEHEKGQKLLRTRMETLLDEAKKVCSRARRVQEDAQAESLQLRKENEQLRAQLEELAPPERANADGYEETHDAPRENGKQVELNGVPRPKAMFSPIRQRMTVDEVLPPWPQ